MDQTAAADEMPPPATANSARSRRLAALARPARGRLRAGAACLVLGGWLLVPQAALIAWVVQQVLVDQAPPATALPALSGLLAVGVLRALLAWAGNELADSGATTVLTALRKRLAHRLLDAGVPWLRRQRSGSLSELTGSHVDALHGYFAGFVPARMEAMAVPVALLAAAFSADLVVGILLLVTLPLIPLFMMLVGWSAEAASRGQLQALARLGGHFADRLRGLGLIRLYGRSDAELAGIGGAAEDLRRRALRVLRVAFMSSAVLEFFASVSVAVIAIYLGFTYLGMMDLRQTPLSLRTGLFCLLLAPEVYAPLRKLAAHYHDRAAALAALDGIDAAIAPEGDTRPDPAAAPAAGPVPAPAIQARGLALRHGGSARDVLSGLDLDIAPGELVAITGPSGCGKSTLLETLAGWLPPAAGSLHISPATRIAYAPQRPFLFHGSIADNLRLARPDADDDALRTAATNAQAMAFVSALPDGLDTPLGERGFGLSGGEARRIALARAYLRDAGLLLLDEPTAFLDPGTEAALLRALREHGRGRTVLVATHSAAVIAAADRVLHLPAHAQGVSS